MTSEDEEGEVLPLVVMLVEVPLEVPFWWASDMPLAGFVEVAEEEEEEEERSLRQVTFLTAPAAPGRARA